MLELIMPQLSILLAFFFVIAAFIGYRRAWKGELATLALLSVGIIAASAVGASWWDRWISLLNDLLFLFAKFMWTIGFKDFLPAAVDPDGLPDLWARIILVMFITVLAYLVGIWVATASSSQFPGKAAGAVIGCINVYMFVSAITDAMGGRLRFLNLDASPVTLLADLGRRTGMGGQLAEPNVATTWLSFALVIIVLGALGYSVVRLAKAR